MWRWKWKMIALSMIGLLLGLGLHAAFATDTNRGGNRENSYQSSALYINSADALGGENHNDAHDDPGPGKGWGGNQSTVQRAVNYEGSMQKEFAHRFGNPTDPQGEEETKLYDWLGRTMHLLQDMAHSFPD